MKISMKTLVAGFVVGVSVAGAGGAAVYAEQSPARHQLEHQRDVEYYLLGAEMSTQELMGRVVNVSYTYAARTSASAAPVVLSTLVSARVCAPLEIYTQGCSDGKLGQLVTWNWVGVAKWDGRPGVPAIQSGDRLELDDFKTKEGLKVNRVNLEWPEGGTKS
jgi:hypothetical protein